MYLTNQLQRACLALLTSLALAACGGGGNDTPSSPSVAGSPKLNLVFAQGGTERAYSTDSAGIPTVALSNSLFQILLPNNGFTHLYVRVTPVNTGATSSSAGDVMALAVDDGPSGWRLKTVEDGDTSLNGYWFSSTVAAGNRRALNVKEIVGRFNPAKTSYNTLYLQFYVPTSPASAVERETIKITL